MQGAERCTTQYDGSFLAGIIANKRNNFIKNIVIKLLMANSLMAWIHVVIHPTFGIDAVNGKNFHFAAVNIGLYGVYQLKPFIFEIVRRRGRNQYQSKTIMSISNDGHLFAQGRTIQS